MSGVTARDDVVIGETLQGDGEVGREVGRRSGEKSGDVMSGRDGGGEHPWRMTSHVSSPSALMHALSIAEQMSVGSHLLSLVSVRRKVTSWLAIRRSSLSTSARADSRPAKLTNGWLEKMLRVYVFTARIHPWTSLFHRRGWTFSLCYIGLVLVLVFAGLNRCYLCFALYREQEASLGVDSDLGWQARKAVEGAREVQRGRAILPAIS